MCTGDEAKCFPKFRKIKQGQLHLKCTPEAERLKLAYKRESASQSLFQRAVLPIEDVEKDALRVVKQMGWDPQNKKVVLGQFILQHGQYRGKNFLWLIENDPGYVLYLCRDEDKKKSTKSKKEGEDNGSRIKMVEKSLTEKLVEYAMLFNEYRSMKEIMYAQTKARQDAEKVGDKGLQLVGFGLYYNMTFEQLAKSSEKDHQSYCAWVKRKDNTRPGSSMHNFRNYLLSLEAKEKPYEPVQSWEPPELEIAKEKPKESHAVRTMKMRGSSDGAISIVSSLMNPIEETHKDLTDAELLASQMVSTHLLQ